MLLFKSQLYHQNKIRQSLKLYKFCALVILILGTLTIRTNAQDNPLEITEYTFIDYDKNIFEITGDSNSYAYLFSQFSDIGLKGKGKVNIVHIGDSHIQADFLSGTFRKKLQSFFLGSISGRGFIFPYKVAKTNNPFNYKVKSKGEWVSCRNVEQDLKCKLGLSGIAIITQDSLAEIRISIADKNLPGYDFDRLMVFHDIDTCSFKPQISYPEPIKISENKELWYTLFEFETSVDSMVLNVHRTDSSQNKFTLHGLNFDSNDTGITYHTVGVNGAQIESYLKCENFIPHLKALDPQWVIVSLGTNDVYTDNFNTQKFETGFVEMVKRIRKAAPDCAILFTTPGDHLVKREYKNENIGKASGIIKQKVQELNISYWDFNSIMGGEGSINAWFALGMAHTDFLHYTRKGYEYQGQLLFNAFLKTYDKFIEKDFDK